MSTKFSVYTNCINFVVALSSILSAFFGSSISLILTYFDYLDFNSSATDEELVLS